MPALIHTEIGLFALLASLLDQLPHVARHEPLLAEKIVDHLMTHLLQVLSQIRTRAVLRRTDQILDVLLFGNHLRKMLFSATKRKSCFLQIAPLLSMFLFLSMITHRSVHELSAWAQYVYTT